MWNLNKKMKRGREGKMSRRTRNSGIEESKIDGFRVVNGLLTIALFFLFLYILHLSSSDVVLKEGIYNYRQKF